MRFKRVKVCNRKARGSMIRALAGRAFYALRTCLYSSTADCSSRRRQSTAAVSHPSAGNRYHSANRSDIRASATERAVGILRSGAGTAGKQYVLSAVSKQHGKDYTGERCYLPSLRRSAGRKRSKQGAEGLPPPLKLPVP